MFRIDAGLQQFAGSDLVTAERIFDADGWLRLASDERMSTLLTVKSATARRY